MTFNPLAAGSIPASDIWKAQKRKFSVNRMAILILEKYKDQCIIDDEYSEYERYVSKSSIRNYIKELKPSRK